MADWTEVARECVRQAADERIQVPGAGLRTAIGRRGQALGLGDFGDYLRERGLAFTAFLAEVPEIVVTRRPGTDVLVGLRGSAASEEPAGGVNGLRQDVYTALTFVSPTPYYYLRSRDEFSPEAGPDGDSIPLPQVSFSDLIAERRSFAEQQDAPVKESLLEALESSVSPLHTFQAAVTDAGLSRPWHEYKLGALDHKLREWAAQQGLAVRESWFRKGRRAQEGAQTVLTALSRHMTDDEIRALPIPFRAVEEFYRALQSRRLE